MYNKDIEQNLKYVKHYLVIIKNICNIIQTFGISTTWFSYSLEMVHKIDDLHCY